MPTVSEVQNLKREVDQLKDRLAQAKGAIKQLRIDKEEQGHEAMKTELIELQRKRVTLESDYNGKMAAYKAAYHKAFGVPE